MTLENVKLFLWEGMDSWPQGETFPVSGSIIFHAEKKPAPAGSLGSALPHSWMGLPLDRAQETPALCRNAHFPLPGNLV